MGVYKVIQDIEAEDKLLGPLSLKQFIFAIVGVLFYYLTFLVIAKHAAFFAVVFLPVALFATFFAWPFSADQPTEVWALAKLRFFFKPRKRIWDQSGVKDLVTITVPKKVAEPMRSSGMSSNEVNSRLGTLANTIDSRGWAIKNANLNLTQSFAQSVGNGSDRLLTAESMPQEVPNYEVGAADDILDEQSNPIAQQFDQMITEASRVHRQELVQMMQRPQAGLSLPAPVGNGVAATVPAATPAAPTDTAGGGSRYWFLNRPGAVNKRSGKRQQSAAPAPLQTALASTNLGMVDAATAGVPTAEEEAFGQQIKAEHQQSNDFAGRMKTIQPLGQLPDDPVMDDNTAYANPISATAATLPTDRPVVAQPDPALLQLAANNDLDVATLARQAHKRDDPHHELGDNEVVISLH